MDGKMDGKMDDLFLYACFYKEGKLIAKMHAGAFATFTALNPFALANKIEADKIVLSSNLAPSTTWVKEEQPDGGTEWVEKRGG